MLYNPKSIANYFLEIALRNGEKLRPMKLQKLVYYAHGWYSGYTGQPLISEPVEAWRHGPVIASIYHEFKSFGSGEITRKATEFDGHLLCEVPAPVEPEIRQFLDNVWKSYGQFTGLKLSEMTHAVDSPWHRTWNAHPGMQGVDIPFDQIKGHFRAAADAASQRAQTA